MFNKESTRRTLFVALVVSPIASVFVAGSAVALKPIQVENRLLDKQRSIQAIAGLGQDKLSSRDVKDLFNSRIKACMVDLSTGEHNDNLDPFSFDPLKVAKNRRLSLRSTLTTTCANQVPRATHDGLYARTERRTRIADPADPRLRPVVHAARIPGDQAGPQYRGRPGLLPARRTPRSRWRGRQSELDGQLRSPGRLIVQVSN